MLILTIISLAFSFVVFVTVVQNLFFKNIDHLHLSHILSISLISFIELLSFVLSINSKPIMGLLFLLSLIYILIKRLHYLYVRILKEFLLVYGFLICIASIVAYPGLWLVGGDWLYHMSNAIKLSNGSFGSETMDLARSPFYSAGCITLLHIGKTDQVLAVYQLWNVLVTTSSVFTLVPPSLDTNRKKYVTGTILIILTSPFFLVIDQNLWPKFASAALFLACFRILKETTADTLKRDILLISIYYCAGIMMHESLLLMAPILFAYLLKQSRNKSFIQIKSKIFWFKNIPFYIIPVSLLMGWQVFTFLNYGFDVRFNSNPAISFDQGNSLLSRLFNNIIGLFGVYIWIDLFQRFNDGITIKDLYFMFVSLYSWLACSIPGIIILFIIISKTTKLNITFLCGNNSFYLKYILTTLFLYCLVLAVGGKYGNLQAGLVPVIWLLLYSLIFKITGSLKYSWFFVFCIAIVQLIPFIFINVFWNVLIVFFPESILLKELSNNDGDFYALHNYNLNMISYFTEVKFLCIIFFISLIAYKYPRIFTIFYRFR